MKQHLQILTGVLLIALLVSSCSKEPATPGGTVKKWIHAIENQDAATLMAITAMPEGQPSFSEDQWKELIIPDVVKEIQDKEGIKEISIKEEQYNNEKIAPGHAFVQYSITYNNGEADRSESMSLVKKEGTWKVIMGE